MPQFLFRALLLFNFCLTFINGFGATHLPFSKATIHPVKVAGYEQFISLDNHYLYYWEDTQGSKFNSNSSAFRNKPFKLIPSKVPNFGFIQHDVWFHFAIRNKEIYNQVLYLSLNNPNLDIAELHYVLPSGNFTSLDQGDLVPMKTRRISSRKIAFKLEIPALTTSEYYLRINNGGEQFHFSPQLQSHDYFFEHEGDESYFLGIYIGILSFVILFNFFMWLITKERLSLNYTLYLITFLFLQLSLLGFGKLFFWQENNYFVNHANPFFAASSVFFLLRFSRAYLDLKTIMPRIDRIFSFFQYPIAFVAFLSILPINSAYTLSIVGVNGLTLLLNLFILPVAMSAIRKGYKPAILFLTAFSLLVVSVFAFILKNFGVLPSNFFTDFGFQIGSAAEVILFSLGIVIRFKNFREEAITRLKEINDIKEKANVVLEEKVQQRTAEIEIQRKEIEEKNTEIVSSISYAKRIQDALLPSDEKVSHLLPSASIWYLPKDIVAGDFYWTESKHLHGLDYHFFAVGDCTGHGVPGAMMSVLCINALNSALSELSTPSTSQLLTRCNELLMQNLSQHNDSINDGMDISICCYEPGQNTLVWSGANNPLWILRNGEIIEVAPTKRPIGRSSIEAVFEEHLFTLLENDFLLLFSDGVIDQFGGPSGKKFKKTQLREIVLAEHYLTSKALVKAIESASLYWMKDNVQIDDIAVLALDIRL